jgi:hypothetical protein
VNQNRIHGAAAHLVNGDHAMLGREARYCKTSAGSSSSSMVSTDAESVTLFRARPMMGFWLRPLVGGRRSFCSLLRPKVLSITTGVGRKAGIERSKSSRQPRCCHPRNYTWAELMKCVFEMDVLECDRCGGRMRILAENSFSRGNPRDLGVPRASFHGGSYFPLPQGTPMIS